MHKLLKILVGAVILFSISTNKAKAYDFYAYNSYGQTLYYNITSSTAPYTVAITNHYSTHSYSGVINIPTTVSYNGIVYSITSISNKAFYYCNGLTSVTIPNSVTSIGDSSFFYCTNLQSITIPNSVTNIGNNIFYNCTALASVTIPNSITTINNNTFYHCSSLTSITIPNNITSIGDSSFVFCTSLSSITIPNSVTSIGQDAFLGCSVLQTLNYNASNCTIGQNAFLNSYKKLVIGDNVTSIPNNLIIPATIKSISTGNGLTSIPKYTFYNAIHLDSVIIGNNITTIDTGAFWGCDSLVSIISRNATPPTIRSNTFYAINSNANVYVPCNSVTAYENATYWSNMNINSFIPINHTYATTCQNEPYNFYNRSLSTAGIYYDTLQTTNGCDSVIALHLSINPTRQETITASICQGEHYTQNGFNVYQAGIYYDTLQTINGCDSILTLILNVNPTYHNDTITANICQGQAYNFHNRIISTAGTYYDTLQTINGCDSIITLSLNVNPTYNRTISASICQGETYNFFGTNLTTTGIYTDTLQTINGCDSIIHLHLSVHQIETTNLTASICQGEHYIQNGFNVYQAGIYRDTLQTIYGCDSIIILALSVYQPTTNNITASICEGEVYTQNGFNANITGTYVRNLQTIHGCDSTVILHLTVYPASHTSLTAHICTGEVYTDNGFYVSQAGTYTRNLQTTNGCDSIITLNLSVYQPASTYLSEEICQGETYTQNGFNENQAGIYKDTLQTTNGCDSIITLNLIVHPTYNNTITATITPGETYNQNGFNADTTGTYTQSYQTLYGCDSIITLNLTVVSGLNDVNNDNISINLYPNPTSNKTTLDIEGLNERAILFIYDLQGRELLRKEISIREKSIELNVKDFRKGIYNVRIINNNNNITKKLIIQ